ncbi:MAG TPA: L-seryl-tRNA(Sec) selenium transferase, partial [Chloroflexia bacterium]|nr:L-seryl-tRNA(Sec) selenium transferase [Chloroflexia bacterium]
TSAVREELDEIRERVRQGSAPDVSVEAVARGAGERVVRAMSPGLRPVINATGVILHTNLGRAPLSRAAIEAIAANAAYSNLEFDLEQGERGSRYVHASDLLRRTTGCEDALVVNNNAAALVLVLTALASGREVVLSRGQAVEIGGGFRIPEIMATSGARLLEVGTTNRTYVADYERAITPDTAAIMRVHASNFRLVGFTTTPGIEELAELAHRFGVLLIDDIGSGALLDTSAFGLAPEPLVQASLLSGADLVLFSGDKLLGGPQCGIIAGRASLIARLRSHPLARALRVGKLTLSALEATLLHYLRGEAVREVPIWRMIALPSAEVRSRAETWSERLSSRGITSEVVEGSSAIGGGSLPGESLPTWLVAAQPPGDSGAPEAAAGRLAAALRDGTPPVICRVERGLLLLDPRTVLPGQDDDLLAALSRAYAAD